MTSARIGQQREMIQEAPVTGRSRSGALPVALHQYV